MFVTYKVDNFPCRTLATEKGHYLRSRKNSISARRHKDSLKIFFANCQFGR